jgi:hypothetical protein
MMGIQFTQYLRPNGRTKTVWIDLDKTMEDTAKELTDCGCVFEIEVLMTNQVSMTCEHDGDVLSHEIVENGPDVPVAVGRLVREAARRRPPE